MLSSRILSGLIFLVVFLLALFNPAFGWALPLILVATALWGTHEYLHFSKNKPSRPYLILAMVGSVALIADAYLAQMDHALLIIGLLCVFSLLLGIILHEPHATELASICTTGVLYVALPLALITLIWLKPVRAGNENAQHYLIFLVAVTWASDIGAFFVGRSFGRHKLAPQISPGKTVEGFIGGIGMTLLIASGMKLFWNNIDRIFKWHEVLFLALAFSIIGPIGDLAESWLKRSSGIKDSGRTFTGHGGMLDIIDSLLFTTIFYYGYLQIFHPDIFHFL